MPELRQHSLFFGTREPNPSSAPAHSLTSPRCRPVPRSTSSQPAANQHSPLRQDASHASLPSTSAPRHNSPDASAPVQARTSSQPLKARQSTARSATVPLKSSSNLVPNHSSKTSRLPTVKPLFTPSRNNSTPHSAVNPPRSPSLPEKPSSTNQQHPSGDHSPAPRQPLKTNRAVRGPPYMGGSKTGKPPSGDFFIPSSHGTSAPVARGENLPGQPRHAAERCASAAGRSVISSPSGPAVTSTRLPSSTVPSSNMPASRSCRFRWMTRRSGRAP
ncbi:hypothetical protein RADP37_01941 [Roseomonas mucosa]|uniref:Uncharacterized protein n=1 Tax=Roseomonas mucosa TaxID=207340 RepID=A0A4Y1MYA2_9PROT|nr:hypothetical protein RADP37_01941 [Roseomonas mucosa]